MAKGLIRYKGKWVEINKGKLEVLLKALDRVKDLAKENTPSIGDAMGLELRGSEYLNIESRDIEVSISNGQWLKNMKERLTRPAVLREIPMVPF